MRNSAILSALTIGIGLALIARTIQVGVGGGLGIVIGSLLIAVGGMRFYLWRRG